MGADVTIAIAETLRHGVGHHPRRSTSRESMLIIEKQQRHETGRLVYIRLLRCFECEDYGSHFSRWARGQFDVLVFDTLSLMYGGVPIS